MMLLQEGFNFKLKLLPGQSLQLVILVYFLLLLSIAMHSIDQAVSSWDCCGTPVTINIVE